MKNSKRFFYFFMVVLSTVMLGCSKDNDEVTNSNSIIGKWQIVQYSDPSYAEPCDYRGWTEFLQGGKLKDFDACSNTTSGGTYTINGSTLTMTSDSFPIPIVLKIISSTATTLVVEFSDFSSEKIQITYKKI